MEKLTIQDASRKLNISQRVVREYIRSGDLKAERDPESEHGRWLVIMPPEGEWQDKFKTYLDELATDLPPVLGDAADPVRALSRHRLIDKPHGDLPRWRAAQPENKIGYIRGLEYLGK